MAETIKAKNQTLSKEEAAKAGVTITGDSLALSDDNLAVSRTPEPVVKQEEKPAYVADRALHLTADGKVVEEDDPAGKTVLVGKGGSLSAADAKKYGLSNKAKDKDAKEAPASSPAPKKAEDKGK